MKKLRLGLLGHPVAHSKSPELHYGFAKQLDVDIEYKLFDIAPNTFAATIAEFKKYNRLDGFNITAPYKSHILPYLDSSTNVVSQLQSCNTVIVQNGGWHGDSTDGDGWYQDIVKKITPQSIESVLVLGFGAAARAICWALQKYNFPKPTVCVRDVNKYCDFSYNLEVMLINYLELDMCGSYDLIVHATSVGHDTDFIELPSKIITASTYCYDLNYNQAHNWFKQYCNQNHAVCVDGLGMLQEQAYLAFITWLSSAKARCI